MFGQFRGSIIRLIEKVLLARDKNWKRKFIRSDILSTFRFRLLLELITVYQLLHLYKYFSKIYDRMRKKKNSKCFAISISMDVTIRVKVGSSGYPRNFKFNVLVELIRTEYRTISSFPRSPTSTRVRIEIHVAYVTFSSPVLPAGLFGNTFFMNIPDMFCDLLELPLCRST